MTLKEFEDYVREELESGVEYADIIKLAFSVDTDGDPAGELFMQFGQHEYTLRLIVGEDGKPGIHTYDYSTIELSQESIFGWCLFESHKKIASLLLKHKEDAIKIVDQIHEPEKLRGRFSGFAICSRWTGTRRCQWLWRRKKVSDDRKNIWWKNYFRVARDRKCRV